MKIDDSSNNNKNIPCKQHHEAQPSTNILSKLTMVDLKVLK